MPFLGVSSLDLGRFTKVTPAFFLVVLLGRLAAGLHDVGQGGKQPGEDSMQGEPDGGIAAAPLECPFIEIQRPIDLDLQRVALMRRGAVILGDETA